MKITVENCGGVSKVTVGDEPSFDVETGQQVSVAFYSESEIKSEVGDICPTQDQNEEQTTTDDDGGQTPQASEPDPA